MMVSKELPLPQYSEKQIGTKFQYSVTACGVTAIGVGTSKKIAKKLSAENILKDLMPLKKEESLSEDTHIELPEKKIVEKQNYVGQLNEYGIKNYQRYAEYEEDFSDGNELVMICKFVSLTSKGKGITKKEAKQVAAMNMIELLKTNAPPHIKSETNLVENRIVSDKILEKFRQMTTNLNTNDCSADTLIKCEQPYEFNEKKLNADDLEQIQKEIPSHTFIDLNCCDPFGMILKLCNKNFMIIGTGKTKEEAKINALLKTYEILSESSLSKKLTINNNAFDENVLSDQLSCEETSVMNDN